MLVCVGYMHKETWPPFSAGSGLVNVRDFNLVLEPVYGVLEMY
jgi:hypothetical protein